MDSKILQDRPQIEIQTRKQQLGVNRTWTTLRWPQCTAHWSKVGGKLSTGTRYGWSSSDHRDAMKCIEMQELQLDRGTRLKAQMYSGWSWVVSPSCNTKQCSAQFTACQPLLAQLSLFICGCKSQSFGLNAKSHYSMTMYLIISECQESLLSRCFSSFLINLTLISISNAAFPFRFLDSESLLSGPLIPKQLQLSAGGNVL